MTYFLCLIGLHWWEYLTQRTFRNQKVRVCKRCKRREVLYFWFNSGDGYWQEEQTN